MNKKTKLASQTSLRILAAIAMASSMATPAYSVFAEEPVQTEPEAPEVPAVPETPAPEQPETPAEETPAPAETPETPETPAAPEVPAEQQTSEESVQPSVEEKAEPAEPAREAEPAADAEINGMMDVDASLDGMVANEMATAIPVAYNDQTKAAVDTEYTGTATLNLNLSTLLGAGVPKYEEYVKMWSNAKYWTVEGPNHQAAVITINVALPAEADASFGQGSSTISSSLITAAPVTSNGKTASVAVTLSKTTYDNLFMSAKNGTAGTVTVTIPYTGKAAKGTDLDKGVITAEGSGKIEHLTGIGIPIDADVVLTQGTSGAFYKKGDPYTYLAGIVDDKIEVSQKLYVNQAAPEETVVLKKGDTFSLTGELDVTPIKAEIKDKIDKYGALISQLGKVALANTSTTFDAVFNLPAGVEFSGSASDLVFKGSDAFTVSDVQKNGQQITAKLTLKDPASITNLEQLEAVATGCADQLKLTVNNLKASDGVQVNFKQNITGTINGKFHSDVTFENGAKYDVNFTFEPANEAMTSIKVEDPIPMDASITVPAELSIQDEKPGDPYTTEPGKDFSITGSIEIGPIADELNGYIKDHGHASGEPEKLPIKGAEVEFEAEFNLPEGLSWKEGSKAEFTGSDAFKVADVTRDGQKVTVRMVLSNPDSVKTLQDLVDICENAQSKLSMKLDGFSADNTVKNGEELTVKANVSGKMHAIFYSSLDVPYEFNITFNGDPEPEGTVKIVKPLAVDKTVPLPADLKAGEQKQDSITVKTGAAFPLSVTVDTAPMKTELKQIMSELDTDKDPKEISLDNLNAYFDAYFALPAGMEWKDGSEAVVEGNSPFKVISTTKVGDKVRVQLGLKNPSSVKTLQDLMNLLDNADPALNLKVNGFTLTDKAPAGKDLTVTADVDGRIEGSGTVDGRPLRIAYTFTGEKTDASVKTEAAAVKPAAKPAAKPSQSAKKNTTVKTSASEGLAQSAFVAGAAALGAAVLALFGRKNRK